MCRAVASLSLLFVSVVFVACGVDPDRTGSTAEPLAAVVCGDAGRPANRAPLARLRLAAPFGPSGLVPVGAMFTLDARRSSDIDGDALTFAWQIVANGQPLAHHATVDGLAFSMAVVPASILATVTVTDAHGASSQASLMLSAQSTSGSDAGSPPPMNRRPVANLTGAPPANSFDSLMPAAYTLSGASSTDPDGDALVLTWRVLDRPYGSTVPLTAMGPTFTLSPDLRGDYAVQLQVTDTGGLSDTTVATWHLTVAGTRCWAPLPAWGFTDYQFDAPQLSSDIIRAAAQLSNGKVDLRLQFCSAPFAWVAPQRIRWCFDTDANPDTGTACGAGGSSGGAESSIELAPGANGGYALSGVVVGQLGGSFDACSDATFDPATNTLRVLIDASKLGSPSSFGYLVSSSFSGPNGAGNDEVPQLANFLGNALSPISTLPTFSGVSLCALRP